MKIPDERERHHGMNGMLPRSVSTVDFFFDTAENERKESNLSVSLADYPAVQKKRLSRRTSCSAGTVLETPGEFRFSSNDVANALAAVHPNRLRQRLNQAAQSGNDILCLPFSIL